MKKTLSFITNTIISISCLFSLTNCACIHNFEKKCTATCAEDGENIYTCKKCGQTKSEFQKALGHDYAENGYCNRCNNFKFNVTCSTSLPAEFSYISSISGYVFSKVNLTKVEFSIYDGLFGEYLCAKFYGNKIYDADGDYATNSIHFLAILRDDDGNVLKTKEEFASSLIVGQQIGDGGFLEDSYFIDSKNLSEDGKYSIEIRDYIL